MNRAILSLFLLTTSIISFAQNREKETTDDKDQRLIFQRINMTNEQLISAANNNDAVAAYRLFQKYSLTGFKSSFDIDLKKGALWLQKSADLNFARAQKDLAYNYGNGSFGFPRDENKMIFWYKKASVLGSAKAQFDLGLYYYLHDDKETANYYFKLAAKQGNADAIDMLD